MPKLKLYILRVIWISKSKSFCVIRSHSSFPDYSKTKTTAL